MMHCSENRHFIGFFKFHCFRAQPRVDLCRAHGPWRWSGARSALRAGILLPNLVARDSIRFAVQCFTRSLGAQKRCPDKLVYPDNAFPRGQDKLVYPIANPMEFTIANPPLRNIMNS